MTQRLVVVGNGMAGGRFLEELFALDPDAHHVTMFGAEPRPNYNRIMLSPVLAGESTFEEIVINDLDWYRENGVDLKLGVRITEIDRENKVVRSDDGEETPYDKLVLATGSDPFIIPVPGKDLPGVITFRDLDDVNTMLAACESKSRAVVIGGGLLGLEAAHGLNKNGMQVTVLHLMDTLMERQLDQPAGYLLEQALAARGIDVRTKSNTKEIVGDASGVTGVVLDDGSEIPADIVVMAVGIRPNVTLGSVCDITVERGVVVDDTMTTSDPDILAVGECVQHNRACYGLVAPIWDMCRAAAATLMGRAEPQFHGAEVATKLKVSGVDVFSAGDFAEGEGREEIVFRDAARGIYKRLIIEDDKLIGAVMYGDTADGSYFFQRIKDGEPIGEDERDTLIFGQGFAGAGALDPMAAVAALPDDAEICGCNGVSKGNICGAITDQGLTDVDGVRACTKASSSCGTCTGLVESLLALTLGDGFDATKPKTVCGCTDFGHSDVRRLIAAKGLKSIPAVMQELEWKTSCGCAKCRPALNYYLLAAWPGEYVDDSQSRFINERVHANIQKDGTYSVVPRAWGGMTTAAELRAVADVVDKYDIPTVKYTGGQRIDMLGVKKEDLPSVWADLNAAGMVSGHAYGKSLRTVKTCVGSEWCRFGTQDSTGLGIKLEKMMWGSWTPHKVKLAVSGCPRNCAEATCKDIGVVCVDSGYEIHFAGAAGMHVKATELLCNVTTEDEALEYCAAVLQLYREQGWYLERIYKWADRVGVDTVRAQIQDDAIRTGAYQRFLDSQKFSQTDPWAERATGGVDAGEFYPLEAAE